MSVPKQDRTVHFPLFERQHPEGSPFLLRQLLVRGLLFFEIMVAVERKQEVIAAKMLTMTNDTLIPSLSEILELVFTQISK